MENHKSHFVYVSGDNFGAGVGGGIMSSHCGHLVGGNCGTGLGVEVYPFYDVNPDQEYGFPP